MISRFICPVNLFPELKNLLSAVEKSDSNVSLSALSSGGNNQTEFLKNLENDLTLWKEFITNLPADNIVDSFEVKLPEDIFFSENRKDIDNFIGNIALAFKLNLASPVFIYLEGITALDQKKNSERFIESISYHNLNGLNAGFKLRTGGVAASQFPAPGLVAHCIRRCLDYKVQMKFTAGLHHPFKHFDKTIGTMMHGFINIFGAGIIAMRHDISDTGIEEILNDEDPGNFIFTDEYFSWKDWKIEIEDIEYARKNLVLSFGSCSVDEPVEDLKELDLLN